MLQADVLKKEHPGCGVEKMYYSLKPDFIGRDRFIDTFMGLGYRVVKHKNYRKTTRSVSTNYANLIKGLQVNSPSTVWQSDITYIRIGEKYHYAVFIIDVYTKKIVGYQVSDHMRATANLLALKKALKGNKAPKIHHSDRGSQYIYKDYIGLLQSKDCKISMALSAQDNAYAERINRTIKEEYLKAWKPISFQGLKKQVKKAVEHYNKVRPHYHLKNLSPEQFEQKWKLTSHKNKPLITIFNHQSNK